LKKLKQKFDFLALKVLNKKSGSGGRVDRALNSSIKDGSSLPRQLM
jgi:hypothetical protein